MTAGETLQVAAGLCLLWFSLYMAHQSKDDRRRKAWKNIIAIIMLAYVVGHAADEFSWPDEAPRDAVVTAPARE
jgi:hypothetical protein